MLTLSMSLPGYYQPAGPLIQTVGPSPYLTMRLPQAPHMKPYTQQPIMAHTQPVQPLYKVDACAWDHYQISGWANRCVRCPSSVDLFESGASSDRSETGVRYHIRCDRRDRRKAVAGRFASPTAISKERSGISYASSKRG